MKIISTDARRNTLTVDDTITPDTITGPGFDIYHRATYGGPRFSEIEMGILRRGSDRVVRVNMLMPINNMIHGREIQNKRVARMNTFLNVMYALAADQYNVRYHCGEQAVFIRFTGRYFNADRQLIVKPASVDVPATSVA